MAQILIQFEDGDPQPFSQQAPKRRSAPPPPKYLCGCGGTMFRVHGIHAEDRCMQCEACSFRETKASARKRAVKRAKKGGA